MDALKPSKLVGASGSFDTLADLVGTRTRRERPDHAQSPEPHPGVDPIPLESWTEVCHQLTTCDVHHRRHAGHGSRACRPHAVQCSPDPMGLKEGSITSMCRAPYALREGVLSRVGADFLAPYTGVRGIWHHLWATRTNPFTMAHLLLIDDEAPIRASLKETSSTKGTRCQKRGQAWTG